uniref:RRM domain-containing protein n=1 Tax=Arcella intermedia TaxID=1963864 RepID=A0A6B2LGT2_9EUKA
MRESTCLFVGNLSYNIRERELRDYMERCGRVKAVTVGVNSSTGQSKGYGFVEFEDRRDAEEAYEKYHGFEIDGRKIRMDWDVGIDKKMGNPAYRARRTPYRGGGRRPSYRSSSRSPPPRSRRRYSGSPRRPSSRSPPPRSRYSRSPRRTPSRSPPARRPPSRSGSRSPSKRQRSESDRNSPSSKRPRNYHS